MAGIISNKSVVINGKSVYTFSFIGGTIAISTGGLQVSTALVAFPMYGDANAAVMNISGEEFIGGNNNTPNKFECWAEGGKCYIRNNFSGNMLVVYTELAVRKV